MKKKTLIMWATIVGGKPTMLGQSKHWKNYWGKKLGFKIRRVKVILG